MTDDLAPAISFATQLRELGVKTQIYSENKKFKQKMAYADKIGAQYVVLIGEDEIKEGKVTAKDMFSGSQVSASPAMIAAGIADAVKKKSDIAPIKEPAE